MDSDANGESQARESQIKEARRHEMQYQQQDQIINGPGYDVNNDGNLKVTEMKLSIDNVDENMMSTAGVNMIMNNINDMIIQNGSDNSNAATPLPDNLPPQPQPPPIAANFQLTPGGFGNDSDDNNDNDGEGAH